MDVYLINTKNNEQFHFPVNPLDEISKNKTKRYETVDIVDIGEADISIKGENIRVVSFDTLFPSQYYEFCRYSDVPNPKEVVNKLEKWMDQEEPLRLIITNFDFNDLVFLSDLDESEVSGEIGDKYASLTFRTNKELIIDEIKQQDSNVSTPQLNDRVNTQSKSNSHTVVKGDSLYKISKRYYGDGSSWRKIYNANKSIIGSNPDIIKPGQKLVIP